jgi:hypothetical protein
VCQFTASYERRARKKHGLAKGAEPGEGVEDGPEDNTTGSLLVHSAEVLDVHAADGKLALFLVEPAGCLGVRGEGEEEDDSEGGGNQTLHDEDSARKNMSTR